MRDDFPSVTACFVAAARGIAGVDPIAADVLPLGFAQAARLSDGSWSRHVLLVDFMRVRTIAIDRAIDDAQQEGTRQLVILGAGLCARAWRMASLVDTHVYEVDHPASQRYKRSRLAFRRPLAGAVKFVSVDFEKDEPFTLLADAGHDRTAPTTWVWEGVTPYLTHGAIAATLDGIGRASSAGSTLAMTYVVPPRAEIPAQRLLHALARPLLGIIGEPLARRIESARAQRLVTGAGFTIEDDASYPDYAERLGGARSPWNDRGSAFLVGADAPSGQRKRFTWLQFPFPFRKPWNPSGPRPS